MKQLTKKLFLINIKIGALECLQVKWITKDEFDKNLAKKYEIHKILGIWKRLDPDIELYRIPDIIPPEIRSNEVQNLYDNKELNKGIE